MWGSSFGLAEGTQLGFKSNLMSRVQEMTHFLSASRTRLGAPPEQGLRSMHLCFFGIRPRAGLHQGRKRVR